MSEREDFWIECDGCGKETTRYGTGWKAKAEAIAEGWIVMGNFSYPKHYCADCQRQGKVPARQREVQP